MLSENIVSAVNQGVTNHVSAAPTTIGPLSGTGSINAVGIADFGGICCLERYNNQSQVTILHKVCVQVFWCMDLC